MRKTVAIVLLVLAGCSSTEVRDPPPEPAKRATPEPKDAPRPCVELKFAEPSAVVDALKVAYPDAVVRADGKRLYVDRPADGDPIHGEIHAYAQACDESAARLDARSLPNGTTTVHEIVRVFARARSLNLVVDAHASDAKIEVVAFDAAASAADAWSHARKLLELRGVRCEEKQRAVFATATDTLLSSWTPAGAIVETKSDRVARALLDLEADVLAADGIPNEKTQALAAIAPGRLILLGDKARVVTTLERLKMVGMLDWSEDKIFFCLDPPPSKSNELAQVLHERCDAATVAGTTRLGVLVPKGKGRQAKALAEVVLQGEKRPEEKKKP